MPRGYVSSDEDDFDDYDFGYSEPLVIRNVEPENRPLPEIRSQKFKEKLALALEESQLIKLLSDVADQGDIESLRELIAHGVNVDSSAPGEWTPLMKACVSGNYEMVELLLEHGSNPNKQKELFSPLMACCTHTLVAEDLKLNCVRLLLQHGADVNAKDKYRTTALMYATGSGYNDIVSELLEVPGVNVNLQDKEGWTALFYAVNHRNAFLVEKLLSAGTDLKLKDKCERTVLCLALDKDLKDIAEMLGYVEEVYPEPEQELENLGTMYLSQLPDSEGRGGFSDDAKSILAAFKKTNLKKISLPDLLNATDGDLYEIGIKLRPERMNILSKGIHRFHLQPWRKSSLQELPPKTPLSLENIICISGTIARHLTVANASLRYLKTRISMRKDKNLVDMSLEKDMVLVLIDAYGAAEKLKELLSKILTRAEQIKPEIPSDYIDSQQVEKNYKKYKFLWYSIGAAATAALIIGYYRKTCYFGQMVYSHY